MPYLAAGGLGVLFIAIGILRRRRAGEAADKAFVGELIYKAYGLAGALAGAVYPVVWLTVSSAFHGGPIASNLPPGYDENILRRPGHRGARHVELRLLRLPRPPDIIGLGCRESEQATVSCRSRY